MTEVNGVLGLWDFTHRPVLGEIEWLLDDLGLGGSESVAAGLAAREIRGRIHDACECPVSRFIRSCVEEELVAPEQVVVSTSETHIEVSVGVEPRSISVRKVLPWAVVDFVAEFDAGAYPSLVERD